MNLSKEQLEVVLAKENRIAVIGPPGTGKTRVLTERIRYLLENGIEPQDIVAITFTNFAANEMKSRLPENNSMFIGTMHSYAIQILLLNHIPVDISQIAEENKFEEIIKQVNDNINSLELPIIKYLFVDEVQDLCDYEFEFVSNLRCENIFLGGDADQCIYQFKGARPELFNSYCREDKTTLYTLTCNFRSGQNIIDFGEYFLKDLPNRIKVNVTSNSHTKGWVNRCQIDEAITELYTKRDYGSWFVLTRTNQELDSMARILEEYSIPFITFKQKDFTNEEIQAFLKEDKVKLLTIHSAKGLETDNVIVIGARNWDSKEEKCIEYVAATRARKLLLWCPSMIKRPKVPSRFYRRKKEPEVVSRGIVWD